MRGPRSQVMEADSEEDEDSMLFTPLDSKFSYSATLRALEVIPTQYIKDGLASLQVVGSENTRTSKNYGMPADNGINTRHVSGKKIDRKHAQYALSAGMMLGVRECVGGMSDITGVDGTGDKQGLTLQQECHRVEKFKIPAGAYFVSSKMASLPYRYKFKAYAPTIFHRIRDMAGVDKQLFLHSICGSDTFIEFVSNAKSGQFFFYSHDGRYMIKTQTQEEKTFLRHILPDYYNHLKDNPHSFLTHFYGMYRVKIPDLGKSIHFVIMKSVFNTELEIHKIWDLKGSTLGRRAKRGDSVHKDLDIKDEGRKIRVGKETKEGIMNTLKKDAEILAKMHIMDYSLLLGVHLSTSSMKEEKRLMLARTNTPMRRKNLVEVDGHESVMEHLINIARSRFSKKAVTADSISLSPSQTTSAETTDYNNSSDDESDDSDREVAERGIDGPVASYLGRALPTFDLGQYQENTTQNPYSKREDHGIESKVGNEIQEVYFAGIIDILQLYNARKWGETIARKTIGSSEADISCVNPDVYADRFVDFMDDLLE